MKCKTCKIELESPYYITCDVCGKPSCMTHGVEMPEGFACSDECAKLITEQFHIWKGDAYNPDPVEELMRDERRYGQEPDEEEEQ